VDLSAVDLPPVPDGEMVTVMRGMPDVHGVIMTPITSTFIAGLAGLFLMREARDTDGRLAVVGYRAWQVIATRFGVLAVITLVVTAASLGWGFGYLLVVALLATWVYYRGTRRTSMPSTSCAGLGTRVRLLTRSATRRTHHRRDHRPCWRTTGSPKQCQPDRCGNPRHMSGSALLAQPSRRI
jgi:hypothetical protein